MIDLQVPVHWTYVTELRQMDKGALQKLEKDMVVEVSRNRNQDNNSVLGESLVKLEQIREVLGGY